MIASLALAAASVAILLLSAPSASAFSFIGSNAGGSSRRGRHLSPSLTSKAISVATSCQLRHLITDGDSCMGIASTYNVSISTIQSNNDGKLDCTALRPNDIICILKRVDAGTPAVLPTTNGTAPSAFSDDCSVVHTAAASDSCASLVPRFSSNLLASNATARYVSRGAQFALANPTVDCGSGDASSNTTALPAGTRVCLTHAFDLSDASVARMVSAPTPASGCTATFNLTATSTCHDALAAARARLKTLGYDPYAATSLSLSLMNTNLDCSALPSKLLSGTALCIDQPTTLSHSPPGTFPVTPDDDDGSSSSTASNSTGTTAAGSSTVTWTDQSFAGVNSYFLWALTEADQTKILDALVAAKYRAVRIFINHCWVTNKGSSSLAVDDLEDKAVGAYNDTVLVLVDALMVKCKARGLKLVIALHDRYSLGSFDSDAYYWQFGQDASQFYSNSAAVAAFDARLQHALRHRNGFLGGRAWRELDDVVLAFEPENEAFGHMSGAGGSAAAAWTCGRAGVIRAELPAGSGILVATGGGTDFDSSATDAVMGCAAVDVVAVHSYGSDGGARLAGVVARAKSAGKRVVYEEFGSTGDWKASSNVAEAKAANAVGVPFFPWQVMIPGNPGDYEFWTDDTATWGGLQAQAAAARDIKSPWTWPW
ncbi:glycoside hydrolase superfamily [Zopfochytrium polystomum]|nr:glycoside hydrolase superfamily [Zopfochytrium polystomum]